MSCILKVGTFQVFFVTKCFHVEHFLFCVFWINGKNLTLAVNNWKNTVSLQIFIIDICLCFYMYLYWCYMLFFFLWLKIIACLNLLPEKNSTLILWLTWKVGVWIFGVVTNYKWYNITSFLVVFIFHLFEWVKI